MASYINIFYLKKKYNYNCENVIYDRSVYYVVNSRYLALNYENYIMYKLIFNNYYLSDTAYLFY